MKKLSLVTTMIAVAVIAGSYVFNTTDAEAQSGNRRTYGSQPQQSFEARFWSYLQDAKYAHWAPGPGQNGGFYEGQSPHGAFLKMYLNRTAAANPQK